MAGRIAHVLLAAAPSSSLAGPAPAGDESAELRHHLTHEGYLNTWPSVNVSAHDGIATVYGHVEGELDRLRVARVVADAPGIREGRNHIQVD